MIIRLDKRSEEPLYLQIRAQIIEAIARESLAPEDPLPSVRSLAQDLGINLHTVNKAYAVLRDEGYLLLKGRKGAFIADPSDKASEGKAIIERQRLEEGLRNLAIQAKAQGRTKKDFSELLAGTVEEVFGGEVGNHDG